MKLDYVQVKLSQIEVTAIREAIKCELTGCFNDEGFLKTYCRTYQLKAREELLEHLIENGDELDFASFDLYYKLGHISVVSDEGDRRYCTRWFIMDLMPEECLYKEGEEVSEDVSSKKMRVK